MRDPAAMEELATRLATVRREHPFPAAFRSWPERFTSETLSLLFPHFEHEELDPPKAIADLRVCVEETVADLGEVGIDPAEVADAFVASLAGVYEALLLDAKALFDGDPAAESLDQVIFSYPGFYAVAVYRLAHELCRLGVPLLPRMVSEFAHSRSGIDIHPAAKIGCPFTIDHGTGVVIGETAVIGSRVKMFHGVTLGAHQVHKRLAGTKRHPTIEDDVVIYAHATILGDIVIGAGSVIGGNTWITAGVPPNSVVSSRNPVRRPSEPIEHAITDFSI
jgi:serine O-acetyltransferase